MPKREIKIINKLGLHARAAAKFVALAAQYQCDIHLHRGERTVNGKSIMGLMMLAAGRDADLIVEAEGEDAEAALDALEGLINERFHEGE